MKALNRYKLAEDVKFGDMFKKVLILILIP